MEKYKHIQPLKGYAVIKEIEEKQSALIKSGMQESRAYAYIVCLPKDYKGDLVLNALICYNEYEGQEMSLFEDKIKEDGLITVRLNKILCLIN